MLSVYDYNMVYRKSEEHSYSDGLSRYPSHDTRDTGTTVALTIHSLFAGYLQEALLDATQVAQLARTDSELARVYKYVSEFLPDQEEGHLKVFFTKRNDFSTGQGCVLWGTRVIVPSKMREAVLKEIHLGHQGIVKTRALAHKFVWWPNLDSDVKRMCKECKTCQLERKSPQNVPLHP